MEIGCLKGLYLRHKLVSGRSSPDLERPNFSRNADFGCATGAYPAERSFRLVDPDVDDSHLPAPGFGPDGGSEFRPHDAVRRYITMKLEGRFLPSDAMSELRATTDACLERYAALVDQPPNSASAADSLFRSVTARVFEDGTTNWGRVVSLLAFGSAVCQCVEVDDRGSCADLLAHHICGYLLPSDWDQLLRLDELGGLEELCGGDPCTPVMGALTALCLGLAALIST